MCLALTFGQQDVVNPELKRVVPYLLLISLIGNFIMVAGPRLSFSACKLFKKSLAEHCYYTYAAVHFMTTSYIRVLEAPLCVQKYLLARHQRQTLHGDSL